MRIVPANVTAVGTGKLAEAQGGATFWNVNINTGGAGAILKVYNNTSAVAADLICSIDCTNVGSLWYGVYCPKGIFYALSVATADVTIGFS